MVEKNLQPTATTTKINSFSPSSQKSTQFTHVSSVSNAINLKRIDLWTTLFNTDDNNTVHYIFHTCSLYWMSRAELMMEAPCCLVNVPSTLPLACTQNPHDDHIHYISYSWGLIFGRYAKNFLPRLWHWIGSNFSYWFSTAARMNKSPFSTFISNEWVSHACERGDICLCVVNDGCVFVQKKGEICQQGRKTNYWLSFPQHNTQLAQLTLVSSSHTSIHLLALTSHSIVPH